MCSHFVPLVSTLSHAFRTVLICLVLNLSTHFLIYLFTQTRCVYVTWNNYFLVTCSLCFWGVMLYTQIQKTPYSTLYNTNNNNGYTQQTNNAKLDYRIECNVGKTLLCLYLYLSYLPSLTHYMHIENPSLALYLSLCIHTYISTSLAHTPTVCERARKEFPKIIANASMFN